jgi:hypothetical protein
LRSPTRTLNPHIAKLGDLDRPARHNQFAAKHHDPHDSSRTVSDTMPRLPYPFMGTRLSWQGLSLDWLIAKGAKRWTWILNSFQISWFVEM